MVTDPYGNPLRPLTDAERNDPRINAAASRHDDVHACSTYEDDLLVAREMLAALAASAGPSAEEAVRLEGERITEALAARLHVDINNADVDSADRWTGSWDW